MWYFVHRHYEYDFKQISYLDPVAKCNVNRKKKQHVISL